MANIYLGNSEIFDQKYKIRIIGRDARFRRIIDAEGVVTSDFAVSGGNQFESISDAISNIASGTLGKGLGSIVDKLKSARSAGETLKATTGGGQSQFTNQLETRATWSGSNLPQFNFEIQFICLDSEDPRQDVVEKVNSLMRAVYPDKKASGFFTAPLGYSTKENNAGKFDISIGDWFRGTKMIIENISFTYGKEVNRKGKPIYANGNITFRPFQMITYKEFTKYFPRL